MSTLITVRHDGGRATITLARPDLHNAFNDAMMAELTDAFRQAGADRHVRAIVLAAEGKSFCAGADVHWMRRMVNYSLEQNVADADILAEMLHTLRTCPKPVIARVHGAAYGGGVGLIAAADIGVAVAPATFCLSEVKLGIVPAVISPYVLAKMTPAAAQRYFLTAERFDAAEARRIGLIHEVVADVTTLDESIDRLVQVVAANGPEALAVTKTILREVPRMDTSTARQWTTHRIAERRVSAEGQEGLKAFLEKRTPSWAADPQGPVR